MKVAIQKFGRFLSGMVMPNIGAFIAWGLITAFFIPTGWLPNAKLSALVGPMITYLLPLLIGYTGGKLVGGERGGVVGAITTMGVIVSSGIPMFLGAMIVGPIGGYAIKQVDKALDGKIKAGFEMLVNNFSAGIVGMILALIALVGVGPLVQGLTTVLGQAAGFLVSHNMLFLVSIVVEPAKVLFLNNAINHGVFSPLGLTEAQEVGKSIFFLIETNPGPGLGILLAYMFFGKGAAKSSSPGAIIIHFLGGIHEIYFPYILMKPQLILAAMGGGIVGVVTNTITKAGLVAPPSPGSIFALAAMSPKGGLLPVLIGVTVATGVSFVIASALIKLSKDDEGSLEEMQQKSADMKQQGKVTGAVNRIYVACDAGMGSSAMGATMLKNELAKHNIVIEVKNIAIDQLPSDATMIVTHKTLSQRVREKVPTADVTELTNFMDGNFYSSYVERFKK